MSARGEEMTWWQLGKFMLSILALPAAAFAISWRWNASFLDKIVIVGGVCLFLGGLLGGWRPTRESIGKALVFLGIALLGFVASVVFLLPWAADQAAQQFDRAFHQVTQQTTEATRSWIDSLLGH